MGRIILVQWQPKRFAAATIVVLCLIAAMLVPAIPGRAASFDVTDDPVMSVSGQTESAMAGRSIAFVDIDNDDIGDLVVGAPGDSTEGFSAGKVMIYLGDSIKSDPDIEICGSAGERFGFAVARAGDVNYDGRDDLIVGAPSNDSGGLNVGTAYIFFGVDDIGDLPTSASDADVVIQGEDDRGQLGYSVSTAGDANLDGFDDVLIGAPFAGAGQASLFYGGTSMDGTADVTFTGSTDGDWFGYAVAGGLNLDGAAQPDIAVGAPASSSKKGAVQVILGPVKSSPKIVTLTLTSASVGDLFGSSLAVLDYNDDIYGDVAVGAPKADDVGLVNIYYGSALAGKFDRTSDVGLSVGEPGDMFGQSIASGNPRTDGVDDLVVGAPMNDTGGIDAGRAYVFYGNDSADSVPDVVVQGDEAGACFGHWVATGEVSSADYNADLAADFAVGSPYSGASSEGAAYLYLGIRVIVPDNPTLYGYVLDSQTSDGLSDALVTIEGPVSRSVRTTANGSYGLTSTITLPPGTYWVNASYDDYFTGAGQHALTLGTCTNVSFGLDMLPIVQGVISDGNASGPLEDALVEVRDASETLLDELTTDETGEYYFMLELEGDVTITVSKDYYFDGTIELEVAGNCDLTEDLTLNHFPIVMFEAEDTDSDPIEGVDVTVEIDGELIASGETDASGETTIMVPGEGSAYVNASRVGYVPSVSPEELSANEMTTVSVTMDRQPSICGTIVDALFEAPIQGAVVALFESGETEIIDSETSDIFGSYAFDVVEVGTYDLRVTAPSYMREYRSCVEVVADEVAIEDFWLEADSLPPTSEISDPQPGLVCLSPEITVFANATDPNGNDILAVVLYYSHDGKSYKVWGSADTEAPYVFEFDATEAYGDGIYEFYTIAWDCANNKEITPVANDTWIVMNSGVPVSEVDALDAYQSTETFTVSVTGSDPFGVQYVELWYSYDDGAFEKYGEDDTPSYSWEFTAADGDGEYAFYSILVNGLDQTELPPDEPDTSTFLDTTDPTVTITTPAADSSVDTGTVDLGAEAEDDGAGLDYVTYQVDSEDEVVVEITDGDSEFELDVTLELDDGEHTIVVTVTDLLGWESSDEVTFMVDTTDPEVTIVAPVDGSAVNTPDVEVTWTVEDAGTGIELTEVRLDGGSWETVIGTSKLFEDLDDDTYTVEVRVTDGADNKDTAETTFEVDTIDPTVYITDPEEGEFLKTTTVVVKWEQSDIGSGLDAVVIRIDGGDWEATTTNLTEYTSVSEGSHTVEVMATDMAGNDDTDTVTFEVDGTAPIITISAPEDDELFGVNTVTAEWSVMDGGTGIASVEYKLDAEAWVTTTASGTADLEDLAEGEHTFSVRAEDNAGNIATSPVQFVVDTLDPTVEITSPTDGEVVTSEDVTVEYTVDGTGTDIVSVERRVDGGAWESAGESSTTVESLDEGLHTVDIRATDEAGNEYTASVEFTVELAAPTITVTITSPEDDALLSTDSVTVEWTVSDGEATVQVKLDDGSWQSATGDSATFTDLSDGDHEVYVWATDGSGGEGEDSVTFTVDTTPPTVSITAPAEDALLNVASVVVSWTASDAETTERSIDGGVSWVVVTGTSETISSLADGEYTVSIRVTDLAGNDATDSVAFTVDTTPPSVEISAPEDDATVAADVTVEWSADDGSGSGVETVEVRIDEGTWVEVDGSSYEFTDLTVGEHVVDVRATDVAGNEGDPDSVTFTVAAEPVDTTPPTLSITSPANGASLGMSSVTVTWSASDAGSGIDTIEVKLDAGAWAAVTGSSREFTELAEGPHTVSVRATDVAGNSVIAGVTFMVDTVDPSLSITSPEDEWETEDASVTVTWTCTDAGCGIDRIEVRLDDGSYVSVGTASQRIFSSLEVGEHTVHVRAYDKAGNMVEDSVAFTVAEGGGGISAVLVGGIVLAIIIVAALAVVLMRRKKAGTPPAP
jgi:hypothetical protein